MEDDAIPLGVLDRKTYDLFLNHKININGGMCLESIKRSRLNDLQGAINRYLTAKMNINIEWVIEYNELLSYFGINKIEFKFKQ